MPLSRRIELIAALACAVLALLGALYALFGPTVSVSTEGASAVDATSAMDGVPPIRITTTTEHRSMFEDGVEPAAAVALAAMAGLAVSVALIAYMRGRWPATLRTPLLAATGALVVLVLITGFSVGFFFMPAACAAVVASAAALRQRPEIA